MTKGAVDNACRYAANELDRWNDVTGAIQKDSGGYYELQSVIEDAVHIGIQMAVYGEVRKDSDGNIKREI